MLLVNASASSVTARSQVVIHKALAADHEVTVATTNRRDHATKLARGAAATGTEVVAVLGGDGTLNEAANGLVGTDCALSVIPGGSTNVFARSIGLPNDPIEATAVLLESLANNSIAPVGLGSANGRSFLFHAGIGFDAAVVEQVERRAGLKRYAGHPLFVYAAFATWIRHYERDRPRFAVHHEDGTVIDDGYFGLCLNTNPYTYLGNRPFNVAPEATLDRALALVTLRTLSFATTMALVGSALGSGKFLRSHPLVDYRHDLTRLRIVGYGPFPYQVDGDFMGKTNELEICHQPDAMNLVFPISNNTIKPHPE